MTHFKNVSSFLLVIETYRGKFQTAIADQKVRLILDTDLEDSLSEVEQFEVLIVCLSFRTLRSGRSGAVISGLVHLFVSQCHLLHQAKSHFVQRYGYI